MGDQSELQKARQEPSGGLSMIDVAEALPPSTEAYPTSTQQIQYQQNQTTYPLSQYQLSYQAGQSPSTYSQAPVEVPQTYYAYPVSQQQVDVGQTGYQYGSQVGYRSASVSGPISLQQLGGGMSRSLQPAQSQQFNVQPRYGYQQSYPQQLGRAMSIPSYTPSPPSRTTPLIPQSPPYQMYPPSFLASANNAVYSEDASPMSPDPENMLPRGPPRKPKQSGFALWVGNLPRDVQLEELKEFFAIEGLESIFLIRKSNCAFVNYKTEEICSIALQRFNDRRKPAMHELWLIF